MLRRVVVAVFLLGLVGCGYRANFVETTNFRVAGTVLLMSGVITSATPREFEQIIRANPQIRTLVETDVEGSVDDAAMIRMGYRVRQLGLETRLYADSEIFSGAVQLFLAGVERSMIRGAVIGVHSWRNSRRDGAEYPRDSREHALNRQYVEDMLGDDAFYWFTLQAAPSELIHVMTDREIARFGLLTRPIMAP